MGPGLTHHVTGDQVSVEDVPGGGHEAAAVTRPTQGVRVHLQVALTVGFGGEGRQADETDEGTLTCGEGRSSMRTGGQVKGSKRRSLLGWVALSPLCVRMCISSELALGQLLLHCGKGQMRSLG